MFKGFSLGRTKIILFLHKKVQVRLKPSQWEETCTTGYGKTEKSEPNFWYLRKIWKMQQYTI